MEFIIINFLDQGRKKKFEESYRSIIKINQGRKEFEESYGRHSKAYIRWWNQMNFGKKNTQRLKFWLVSNRGWYKKSPVTLTLEDS